MQVSTAEFKKGLRIVFDGQPYAIVDFQHVKPGKGGAFVRTKLKHMRQGKVIDNTFRSGEKVELVEYDEKHMQFLYKDDRYNFMDTENYEQVELSRDDLGDAIGYLIPNLKVSVEFYEDKAIGVELPKTVDLKVTDVVPAMKTATVTNVLKPATTETGLVVPVPNFIEIGSMIRVDTETGAYLSRAK